MKKKNGYIMGVCSTLGNWMGIEPWILRLIFIVFIKLLLGTYLLLGLSFMFFLKDEEDIKKEDNSNLKE
jgi:phage shock protein PspC (stress-responsive transcriptional regulator)